MAGENCALFDILRVGCAESSVCRRSEEVRNSDAVLPRLCGLSFYICESNLCNGVFEGFVPPGVEVFWF